MLNSINNLLFKGLPVNMDRFWAPSNNKMQLQKIFIKWMTDTYNGATPVYLGGANYDDMTSCLKISNSQVSQQPLLKCNHEEADDRILFHVNHGVRIAGFSKIVIASPDADVFVNAVHHYSRWMYCALDELWIISGRSGSKQTFPVHDLIGVLDDTVIDILPAVHALTGMTKLTLSHCQYLSLWGIT